MATIQVKRFDHEAKTIRGREFPACYEVHYYYKGREIANYDSRDDVIYLNSDFIDRDENGKFDRNACDLPRYERALKCQFAEAYATLFEMLGVDATTNLSEFMNAF